MEVYSNAYFKSWWRIVPMMYPIIEQKIFPACCLPAFMMSLRPSPPQICIFQDVRCTCLFGLAEIMKQRYFFILCSGCSTESLTPFSAFSSGLKFDWDSLLSIRIHRTPVETESAHMSAEHTVHSQYDIENVVYFQNNTVNTALNNC